MKRIVHGRRCLLPAIIAMTAASSALAGDVTVSDVDTASGTLKTLATGDMSHAPAHLLQVQRDPVKLIDACGAVYGVETGLYGDKEITGPIHADRSLENVRLIISNRYGGVGVGHDGKPWVLKVSDSDREREGSSFKFAESYETRLDFGKTRLFVKGADGLPDFAFFSDGNLLGARNLQNGAEEARFVAPKGGWGKVKHAVSMTAGTGRERRPVLITVDDAGQMVIHDPVEENQDFTRYVTSMQSKPLGKFTGTKGLVGDAEGNVVYRWTESGDLFAVDLKKGSETRVGAAGAFKGDLLAKPDRDLFLVAHSGSFAPCPKKAAPVVVEAPKKDTSIIAAADEIKALADAHYKTIDSTAREQLPSFDTEFKVAEPEIRKLFEKVGSFEKNVVDPVRAKVDAFVAKYGDDSAAELKLREATGGQMWYMNSRLSWLLDALKRWDTVRPAIANDLLGHANHYALLGEHASDKSKRGEYYLGAKPWAEWALRFQPDLAEARDVLAKADGQAASADAAFLTAIQNAAWPKDVPIEGDAAPLKAKLLKFFQKHHGGKDFDTGARYFAIRLAHDWYVSKTNIVEQPTEWRVSAYIASTVPGDPKHARVYWVEVGTQTGDRNSSLSARYFGSDPYLIPIERVPADDNAALQESLKLISR